MFARSRPLLALVAAPLALAVSPAQAGVGDLLVAPTRIILDGRRGTEIILHTIADDVATYRVTVELRRMKPDGTLETVTTPNARESAAEAMILYAPRKVTLPPNQPQSIRINARAPQGLADGEYRAHLLFRAIPDARPVTDTAPKQGVSFRLTPVYGVTIPVIVRLGNLTASAGIANVAKLNEGGKPVIALDLSRSGDRSTFGEVRVTKAGIAEPQLTDVDVEQILRFGVDREGTRAFGGRHCRARDGEREQGCPLDRGARQAHPVPCPPRPSSAGRRWSRRA
jgi:P pilus assembly chaperone PapD